MTVTGLYFVKVSATLITITVCAGCAVPKYNYSPQRNEISEPPLGSINIANVGDNMLRQGFYVEHDAIVLHSDVEVSLAYTVTKGFFLKRGEDEDSEFYEPSVHYESGRIVKAALADPWQSLQAYKQEPSLCVVTIFNLHSCASNVPFERVKKSLLGSDSFQQTLIYSGKIGNKLNIGYREFSNNLARPAFNNNVEYDLNESMVIGYRGARIEVLEATNESIKYKVIQNFNKAQQ